MRLEWSRLDGHDCLRLTGAAGSVIRIYPSTALDRGLPSVPMAGRRVQVDEAICFLPRFPFVPGTEYTVLVHRGGPNADLEDHDPLTITYPLGVMTPSTRVEEIFPTAASVPRNLLRCYVQFSAPMSEGFAASHVHVRRAGDGAEIDDALLHMEPELWDRRRTRLTVLFDPARIKRGLVPHQEAGYPLAAGIPIEVVVDADFPDAEGRPLVSESARRYEVHADAREHVDPTMWHVEVPRAGTADALVVRFDQPLDHALAYRCITVTDDTGTRMRGFVSLAPGEQEWRFQPPSQWTAQPYVLAIDPVLEDIAGNSMTRVFDRDLTDPTQAPLPAPTTSIAFEPEALLSAE